MSLVAGLGIVKGHPGVSAILNRQSLGINLLLYLAVIQNKLKKDKVVDVLIKSLENVHL